MDIRTNDASVRNMAFAAVFTSALCVVAPFSFSIGPIPISLATLMIYIAAGTLDLKWGMLAVALYVALGAVGMPVFSGFQGGFQKIAGVTGGFIAGYMPCAAAIGCATKALGVKTGALALGMVVGTILLYACGMAWYVVQTGSTVQAGLALCVLPFLPGDAAKIAAACTIAPRLRRALSQRHA